MIEGLSDTNMMRIGIGVVALLVFLLILYSSRGKRSQGKRIAAPAGEDNARVEPTLREAIEADEGIDYAGDGSAVPAMSAHAANDDPTAATPAKLGNRPSPQYDKIVAVYLVARAGESINGSDLVVAAEKAGLVYGHMNIFHRMVEKHPELGPIFSVANLVKPGYFELRSIQELQTPGVNFFITLPGPISALDAWDTLLPTAQRMAELLGAVLLDDERNALGRQRIANIRDELRAYDRAREKATIRPGR
jgi:cell division protein ZipA